MEPAATNIVTVDSIRRFGGSSAVAMPWPEEDDSMEDRRGSAEHLRGKPDWGCRAVAAMVGE